MTPEIEIILNKLELANKMEVERHTGIPSGRIYKWLKGKGNPKAADIIVLKEYFKIETSSKNYENLQSYKPSSRISVAQDRNIVPFGDQRWIDPNLSVMENLEKLINFKKNGDITEKEFIRIKSKIIPE